MISDWLNHFIFAFLKGCYKYSFQKRYSVKVQIWKKNLWQINLTTMSLQIVKNWSYNYNAMHMECRRCLQVTSSWATMWAGFVPSKLKQQYGANKHFSSKGNLLQTKLLYKKLCVLYTILNKSKYINSNKHLENKG